MTTNPYKFSQLGGNISLDFVNTTSNISAIDDYYGSEDHLNNFADLVEWGRQREVISPKAAGQMLERASQFPGEAAIAFEQALKLRTTIYHIFSALSSDRPLPADDLRYFNTQLSEALTHMRLVSEENKCGWDWEEEADQLYRVHWPVTRAAANLMTSSTEIEKIRTCAADDCGWLFLDLSRNHSRQWCDMRTCGNQAKAQRHYHRHRN